ncbi:MAG TPA: hypothetical protein VNJ51_05625 [Candidatus Dormibacteraeota bacterium]|nr:hypothetical protein [Candidatus Dormibacteraeota bacterium]
MARPAAVALAGVVSAMAARSLVLVTQLLLGALLLEVFLYHPATALQRDAWARVPLEVAPAGMAGASWLLLSRGRLSTWLFGAACAATVLVGLAGTAFHVAIHASDVAALLERSAWLGNPPTLAPLAFAVAGLLGLIALSGSGAQQARRAWEAARAIAPARALHALALTASLAAWGAALRIPLAGAAAAAAITAVSLTLAALAGEWVALGARAAPRR